MRGHRYRWLPPLLLMGLIFFLSSQSELPGPSDPLWNRILKKSAHAAGYGALAISYARALDGSRWRRAGWALLLTLLYALSDEWHQTFVAGRDGNLLDVLIDLVGGTVGLLGWQRLGYGMKLDSAP